MLALLLALLTTALAAQPSFDRPTPDCVALGFVRLAESPDVLVRFGTLASIDNINSGHTQNSVLMTFERGTVLVDPGPSPKQAKALERELANQPGCHLKWVINSHPHPENVLANAGFSKAVAVVSSTEVAKVMTARCPRCRARFVEQFGLSELSGFDIRLPQARPTIAFNADRNLWPAKQSMPNLGWPTDLQLLALGGAHSQADLAVLHRRSGLLLTAGVASCRVLPELAEGNVDLWINAMAALQKIPARQFVGAQGGVCPIAQLQETASYLQNIFALVGSDVNALGDAASAAQRLALPSFKTWGLYAERHPLNVQKLYQSLEAKSFEPRYAKGRVRR
jgi:glyoxylase-like metal-dependent hydrolase (beta-lactamase superfamily II)